jgi:hypothetical protein
LTGTTVASPQRLLMTQVTSTWNLHP